MVERIEIFDPKLKAREEKAIADLWALAPDGHITTLDARDSSLGKRLSKLYKAIGYESRLQMIEAFGFTRDEERARGGGRATFDPEQFFEELTRLYADREPAATVGQITQDFPELKAKMKTASNQAKERFGQPLAAELRDRDIVVPRSKAVLRDDEILAMVEHFRELYAQADAKPASAKELFEAHPEYAALEIPFSRSSERLFGNRAKNYLRSIGVLWCSGEKPVDAEKERPRTEGLDEALDDMRRQLEDMPSWQKPVTIKALGDKFPIYRDILKKANSRREITKASLQEMGLLRVSQYMKEKARTVLAPRAVRNASVDELKRVWRAAGLPKKIKRGSKWDKLLPPNIAAVKLKSDKETETAIVSRIYAPRGEKVGDTGKTVPKASYFHGKKATIVAVSKRKGKTLVQGEVRTKRPLRAETLLYGLWKTGAITNADLQLSDSWRERFADVLTEGTA